MSTTPLLATLTSAFLWLVCSPFFVTLSQRWARSIASTRAPQRHQDKNGTPATGGILIIATTIISTLIWAPHTKLLWWHLGTLLCFGALGGVDDWYKLSAGAGIHAHTKFVWQWLCGFTLIGTWYLLSVPTPALLWPPSTTLLSLSPLLFVLMGAFIMVGTSNAVNLTDGLDGLASTQLITVFITLGIIGQTTTIRPETTIYLGALVGSLLGFLRHNSHPATLFMGDVGSLALGASVASIALSCRLELMLPLIGIVFMLETLSVFIQVASIKWRKKRVFNMAPIHHHFELAGWHESRIVRRFWLLCLLGCSAALLLI